MSHYIISLLIIVTSLHDNYLQNINYPPPELSIHLHTTLFVQKENLIDTMTSITQKNVAIDLVEII